MNPKSVVSKQKFIDYVMVIFLYNLDIFAWMQHDILANSFHFGSQQSCKKRDCGVSINCQWTERYRFWWIPHKLSGLYILDDINAINHSFILKVVAVMVPKL